MNKINSKKIYINSSIVLVITYIITLIYCNYLTNLVTRNTLKVLKILTDLNADIADPPAPKKNNSIKLRDTIIASNVFMPSFKYSLTPIPNIFIDISTVKIYVNARLH